MENTNLKNQIDNSETEKLFNKVNKLENLVKKLFNENNCLKAKINSLENTIEKICTKINILKQDEIKNFEDLNINQKSLKLNELTAEDTEETWLYSVQKGVTLQEISNKLNLATNPLIIECKVENWYEENNIFKDLLTSFPKFAEFSEDWSSMNTKQLKHFLQTIITTTLVGDLVIILRDLPQKNNQNYENIISNIGTLAEVMYSSWMELDANGELFGKMALVIESQEEDIQILNITKNNTRLILFVENLFNN